MARREEDLPRPVLLDQQAVRAERRASGRQPEHRGGPLGDEPDDDVGDDPAASSAVGAITTSTPPRLRRRWSTTASSAESTVTSARAPGTRAPPIGEAEQPGRGRGHRATASGTEQPVKATRLRTARSSERSLPASTPSAVRTPPFVDGHLDRPELRVAGAGTEHGHGVGDEVAAIGTERPPRHPHRDRVDVDAVADQAGHDRVVGEGGADRAGVAVGERSHRVEQVGDVRAPRRRPRRRTGPPCSRCARSTRRCRVRSSAPISSRAPGSSGASVAISDTGRPRPAVDQRRRRVAGAGRRDGPRDGSAASIGPSRCSPSGTAPPRRPRRPGPPTTSARRPAARRGT